MPMLNWMGREKAAKATKDVVMKILREDKELSYCGRDILTQSRRGAEDRSVSSTGALPQTPNPAEQNSASLRLCVENKKADNILVHGDNLEALKALLPFYAGEVKCIYIDPPYNTGSAFEHYDDNLEHSTWLNMMYPRLKLLREFMREDGSIWISIDDREGAYLRVICDEIFGRQNFVSNISWQRTYSTRNDAKGIVNEVEHILVYSKREGWQPKKLARTEEMDSIYKNLDDDPQGPWTSDNPFAPGAKTHQGMVYAIQHPFTGELVYPVVGRCWTFGQEEMLAHMNGWCPYELREIDDAEKRAAICGVGVDDVRKGVKAIMLKDLYFNAETQRRREGEGIVLTGASPQTPNPDSPVNPVEKETLRLCASALKTKYIPASFEESKKMAQAVLKRGQWPKFYFTKNGKGGIRRKTYLSAVGDVPPTNLFEYKDVGHTDEAKKEVLKVFDGQSPFATPKPERLIKRVLEIATDEGDLVMDSFLGSGTTAAVAHKMGRRWIGIEMGDHAKTHCAVRMKKVVDGEQGGISKTVKWNGGGGFRFYELGEPLLDERGQIAESIPYDVLAAHIWWQDTGTGWGGFNAEAQRRRAGGGLLSLRGVSEARSSEGNSKNPSNLQNSKTPSSESNRNSASLRLCVENKNSPVLGIHDGVAYALLYNGILHDRSVNGGNVLTRQTLGVIKDDLGQAEYRKLVVYGEWNKLGEERLKDEKIEFRQTPYDVVVQK